MLTSIRLGIEPTTIRLWATRLHHYAIEATMVENDNAVTCVVFHFHFLSYLLIGSLANWKSYLLFWKPFDGFKWSLLFASAIFIFLNEIHYQLKSLLLIWHSTCLTFYDNSSTISVSKGIQFLVAVLKSACCSTTRRV